jgi:hypothetical protein
VSDEAHRRVPPPRRRSRYEQPGPATVSVPTRVDELGRLVDWIECDPEAAGQWDVRRWAPADRAWWGWR